MKRIGAFFLLLVILGCGSKPEKKVEHQFPTKNIEFLNSLTKVEPYELEGLEINSEKTLVYTEDGLRPSQLEIIKMHQSGDYTVDAYRNKEGQIIWLFQPMTEELKKMRADQEKNKNIQIDLTGKDAIPFSLKDIEGNEYSLKNQKGKVIVMNFWFIACGPCVAEMPELNKLVETYKGKKIVFLGFANDKKDKLLPFLKKKLFEYTIIAESQALSISYKVQAFPTHVVIGKDSKIKYYYTGKLDPNTIVDLRNEIDESLTN